MQTNPVAFQDAVARAREIAQKLSASAPNIGMNTSLKRSMNDDDYSHKRPAFGSPTHSSDLQPPALRAQKIAQQINMQLGAKGMPNDSSLPLSNQLTCQEDYKIPDKFVGLVIGKCGEQIIRIQAESGCKVQICQIRSEPLPGGLNLPDRVANLSGTRDAIEQAKRMMDDIVSRGKLADSSSMGPNSYAMGGPNGKAAEIMLPSAKCGLIIGKGGETIRRISVRDR
jgi:far upstream element-binding protein